MERQRPRIKVSEVLRRTGGRVPDAPSFYRPRLDAIWDLFGEDRLLYGSDWPNSDQWAPYPQVLNVVRRYVATKGRVAEEKFFRKNSIAAYRWGGAVANHPGLTAES